MVLTRVFASVFLGCVWSTNAFVPQRVSCIVPLPRQGPYDHRKIPLRTATKFFDELSSLPSPKVVDALSNGGRFTAADVSTRTGSSLDESREALTAITALLGEEAALEVSNDGELVFALPKDVGGRLASRSNAAKLAKTWEAAKPQVFTALRVAFGVGLIVSLAAVYSAIFFISTSSSSSDDDRRDDRRRGGGGGGFGFGGPALYLGPSPFDVFYYRPYYSYGTMGRQQREPQMGILESVYSYVFGDGDPNVDVERRAVRAAASAIRKAGGAVTASQLAPFVPEPSLSLFDGLESSVVDEQFVLPVVSKLQGVPTVTEDGDIVYSFDDLALTTAESGKGKFASPYGDDDGDEDYGDMPPSAAFLEEQQVEFSSASGLNLFLAGGLGLVNLGGCLYLGALLSSLPAGALLPGGYGVIQSVYPLLVAYALAFNAAPLVRSLGVKSKNEAIEGRNAARRKAAQSLEAPTASLRRKLAAARALATGVKRIGSKDVAYSTSEEGQAAMKAANSRDDLDSFDRKLN